MVARCVSEGMLGDTRSVLIGQMCEVLSTMHLSNGERLPPSIPALTQRATSSAQTNEAYHFIW